MAIERVGSGPFTIVDFWEPDCIHYAGDGTPEVEGDVGRCACCGAKITWRVVVHNAGDDKHYVMGRTCAAKAKDHLGTELEQKKATMNRRLRDYREMRAIERKQRKGFWNVVDMWNGSRYRLTCQPYFRGPEAEKRNVIEGVFENNYGTYHLVLDDGRRVRLLPERHTGKRRAVIEGKRVTRYNEEGRAVGLETVGEVDFGLVQEIVLLGVIPPQYDAGERPPL